MSLVAVHKRASEQLRTTPGTAHHSERLRFVLLERAVRDGGDMGARIRHRAPCVSAAGAPSAIERQEVLDRRASVAVMRWDDDANTSVIVEEDLTIASARWDDTAPLVADRDDCFESASAVCSCRGEGNQFGAGATGEVVEVDPTVHLSVHVSNRRADRVHTSVGMVLGYSPRELDEFGVVVSQIAEIRTHRSRPYSKPSRGKLLALRSAGAGARNS